MHQPLPHNKSFQALGTQWQITTKQSLSKALERLMFNRIELFDKTYSRFRDDSLVSQVAKQAGKYTFPADSKPIFDLYDQLYDLTGSKVTPLIGGMLERAGYDAQYSFKQQPQQTLPDYKTTVAWQRNTVFTSEPITLDIGAAGKGYLVDIVSQLLDEQGIHDYVIDASGDMRCKGTIPNIVGLEHPLDPSMVIGSIDLQNNSLCASATNRRSWKSTDNKMLHHIFDPDTQAPVQGIIATWVIADTAMVADGLATALFFTEPAVLQSAFIFDYVRVHIDATVDYSPGFDGHLFV